MIQSSNSVTKKINYGNWLFNARFAYSVERKNLSSSFHSFGFRGDRKREKSKRI